MSDSSEKQFDEASYDADSKADTIAIFFLIIIAAGTLVYLAA